MRSATTRRLGWLLGAEGVERLAQCTVLLFGCGGVGSFAMEALVRSGVGRILLVDGDVVDITNVNRQLVATMETIGRRKVEVAAERCRVLSPYVEAIPFDMMYTKEGYPTFFDALHAQYGIDFVVDAVDMVTAKIDIVMESHRLGIPVIASMGMGNKLDPTQIQIADIAKTSVCPLARVVRKECRKRRITHLPVAFSTEPARTPKRDEESRSPGSCGFVPSVAGLAMAGYVIRQLSGVEG